MSVPEQCPLCAATRESQSVVTAHVYGSEKGRNNAFYHCHRCDVRYQYPGLTAAESARFYAAEFESFMSGRAGLQGGWGNADSHVRANESTRLRRMQYLEPNLTARGRVLEIGCSSGFMLYPLKDAGCECVGIEPSGVFRDYVNSRGVPAFDSIAQLESAGGSGLFDVILHFFVMEHIAAPHEFLESQLTLLKPGGRIIFEIPNVADPLHAVYDIPAFERFYWSVAHPWYFSEAALRYLLSKLTRPFKILRDQRYDLSNHMVWARDGKPGGMGRFTEALGNELENHYKQALIRTGNCDTLIGIITNS